MDAFQNFNSKKKPWNLKKKKKLAIVLKIQKKKKKTPKFGNYIVDFIFFFIMKMTKLNS